MRAHPLDGELLLFDRATGTNILVADDTTRELRRVAPRLVQVAVTNACNKSCGFCYRPLDARSTWTFDELVELAAWCDEWGVVELAFGGGEPLVVPWFAELLRAIWTRTQLCPSFTTNGLRLTREFLRSLEGCYGQIQLSFYDEDDPRGVIDLLVAERARFGINYLVTPARVRTLEADVLELASRGARDVLFLSYKGDDRALHLSARECRMLDDSLVKLHALLPELTLKVDVCWGERLVRTPRLFDAPDCGAGSDFLSITSDKRVLACSFMRDGVPFTSLAELRSIWQAARAPASAAGIGCARRPRFGLDRLPLARSSS